VQSMTFHDGKPSKGNGGGGGIGTKDWGRGRGGGTSRGEQPLLPKVFWTKKKRTTNKT